MKVSKNLFEEKKICWEKKKTYWEEGKKNLIEKANLLEKEILL